MVTSNIIWVVLACSFLVMPVRSVLYTDLMPQETNKYLVGSPGEFTGADLWLSSHITTMYTDLLSNIGSPVGSDILLIDGTIRFSETDNDIIDWSDSAGIEIENVNIRYGNLTFRERGGVIIDPEASLVLNETSSQIISKLNGVIYTYNSPTVHHKYGSFGTNPNIGWGTNALNSLTSGIANIAGGGHTLQSVTTGTSNTAMGNYAGTYSAAITIGSKNTVIGDGSSVSSVSATERGSLGYRAIAQSDYSTQLGQRTVSSGSAATLDHRTQQVISEDDIGSGNGMVVCDDDGNYVAKKEHTNVNQITSITTGVTVNDFMGTIATVTATLSAGSSATFTVTNSYAFSDSTYLVNIVGYGGTYGTNGYPVANIKYAGTNGEFDIIIMNIHPSNALNGQIAISFTIIGGES